VVGQAQVVVGAEDDDFAAAGDLGRRPYGTGEAVKALELAGIRQRFQYVEGIGIEFGVGHGIILSKIVSNWEKMENRTVCGDHDVRIQTMLATPSNVRRVVIWIIASILLAAISGCPGYRRFSGRVLILNATGGDMESLTVVLDGEETTLAKTADGQAWLRDVTIYRSLGFRWRTATGEEYGASEPLKKLIDKNRSGDLMIRLLGPGSLTVALGKLPE
jgi:hypothetical protein